MRKTISTPIWNARKTGGKALCAVMMTAAFLGHQPSQEAASDALKSQSPTTSAASPDEDGGNTVQSGPYEKLCGTWIAKDVDTKIGEVKIKLTFRRVGTMRLLAWSEIPWVAISFGNFFNTGDRLQLGGIKGDVIDIGMLRTAVMEIGEWIRGDQYTGR